MLGCECLEMIYFGRKDTRKVDIGCLSFVNLVFDFLYILFEFMPLNLLYGVETVDSVLFVLELV